MERYIAVDNVCCWPNLTKMPDGTIVATIFNQPTHGGWEGDVECWASTDGRMWKLQGVPAPHEPTTNRMNVAAGMARDGNFIVLASGWSNRNPAGQEDTTPFNGSILPIWICRSGDNGKDWRREEIKTSNLMPFGDIVQLADGNLGVCIYSWSDREKNSYFYTSPDDGRTWNRQSVIGENLNETTPVVLPGGGLLAAGRTLDNQHLELFSSSDSGKTWRKTGPVTLGSQHPAHMLLLKDNRLLLSYGIRNDGLFGVGIRISKDSGKTWSDPRVLVNLEKTYGSGYLDGGYPSTAQTEDGTLVTAYYCAGIAAHARYHMGVVRWKLED